VSLGLFLDLFAQYGYWIIAAGVLLDNAGLPLPGELLLLAFGALARSGQMDLEGGLVLAVAAAMAGDSLGYWLGRLGGDRLLHGYCRVTLGSGKCLQRAVAFYKLRGPMAVVFGRFVMGVRAFLFPLAGSARMPYTKFLLFDGIGALTWVSAFSLAGYSLGWQIGSMDERYRAASTILAVALGTSVAMYLLVKVYRRWRHGRGSLREWMISHVETALRPLSGRTFVPFASTRPVIASTGADGSDPDGMRLRVGPGPTAAVDARTRVVTPPPAAFPSPLTALKARMKRAVSRFLNREVAAYELKVPNDMARVYQEIRKGDVVLVEGTLRISQLVKYATQSQWSHSAFYVGDELLRRGGRLRAEALAHFGELADRLLVEALTDEGVIAVPLEKYRTHNIRICRPGHIHPADLDRVVDSVVADLGKAYDDRNLLDLALMLAFPVRFGPLKTRAIEACLGNCTELQVICSGMIAKAFQRVGYPILPVVAGAAAEGRAVLEATPRGIPPAIRHYSQTLPRDFDVSPNFDIVKFNTLGSYGLEAHLAPDRRPSRPR
jgi:membrane protein DedA with SNARE-associated domain